MSGILLLKFDAYGSYLHTPLLCIHHHVHISMIHAYYGSVILEIVLCCRQLYVKCGTYYSGTPLKRTPLGPKILSFIERCS